MLVLLLGVAVRLAFLLQWPRRLNIDEATAGLIGLHVLRGEFPIFMYSVAYEGTPEAYLGALLYALFGPWPLAAKVVPFLFSCALVAVALLIGKRMAGWPGGLGAALLTALSPPFLAVYGNFPMLGYIEVVVIGSLVLLLALELATAETDGARRDRKLLLLGLLAGLGWWVHPMIVSYLGAAGLLLLLTLRRWVSRWVAAVPLAVVVGSLPAWVFDLHHSFWTFAHVRRGTQGDVLENAAKIPPLLLETLGLRTFQVRGAFTDPVPVLAPVVGVLYLALLAILVLDLLRPRADEPDALVRRRGVQLLLLFPLLHFTAFSLHDYAKYATTRYFFPLYSAVPVLTAVALLRVARWSRVLAAGALGLLLLNNALTLGKAFQAFEALRAKDWWRPDAAVAFLDAQGLTRTYADAWIGTRITFETGERLVVADPSWYRYRPHFDWVNAAPRVAYLLSDRYDPRPAWFEAKLGEIGAGHRRRDFGELAIFYDFRPAAPALASVPPTSWRAETRPPGYDPALAFDRDVDTAWLSGEFMKPGLWYRLDLGRLIPVAGVTILPVRPRLGVPVGYRIELSRDGTTWEAVASEPPFKVGLRWGAGQPRMDWTGSIVHRFAPHPARYVRITQTGARPDQWWAIAELFVYTPVPGPATPSSEAQAALEEGIRLERERRWERALATYVGALRADPELEEAHWRLAQVYSQAGLPLEGTDWYRRALVFEELGLLERAARELEVGLAGEVLGARSDPLARLLAIYRRQGELGKAAELERRLGAEFTPPTPAQARFGGAIRLLGYGLTPREPAAGETVELQYYWEALKPHGADLAVFVHFVLDGKVRFQQDHEPLLGGYPTSRWQEGERVRERYAVQLPADLPPGEYEIRVGLWNPRTGKRLPVTESALPRVGQSISLARVRVLPRQPP